MKNYKKRFIVDAVDAKEDLQNAINKYAAKEIGFDEFVSDVGLISNTLGAAVIAYDLEGYYSSLDEDIATVAVDLAEEAKKYIEEAKMHIEADKSD